MPIAETPENRRILKVYASLDVKEGQDLSSALQEDDISRIQLTLLQAILKLKVTPEDFDSVVKLLSPKQQRDIYNLFVKETKNKPNNPLRSLLSSVRFLLSDDQEI